MPQVASSPEFAQFEPDLDSESDSESESVKAEVKVQERAILSAQPRPRSSHLGRHYLVAPKGTRFLRSKFPNSQH